MRLKKMKVNAVALVDKGANRKEFFLIKKFKGENTMKKETVIALIKSGNLTKEQKDELVNSVAEGDRKEVLEIAKASDAVEDTSEGEMEVEQVIEKVATKLSKATEEQLKVITETITAVKDVLQNLVDSLKDGTEGEGEGMGMDDELEKGTAEDPEVSDEEFQANLNKKLEEIKSKLK